MSKSRLSFQGHGPMNHSLPRIAAVGAAAALPARLVGAIALIFILLAQPGVVHAGKLSWLDDLVQEVILEAKAGGKAAVRGGDGARTEIRGVGRLFVTRDADETLEQLVRRSDELARAGRRVEQPTEAVLHARFSRLLKQRPANAPGL